MRQEKSSATRRDFMRTAAVAGVGAGLFAIGAHSADAAPIRVGLIGCGRRGTGAAKDCVQSSPNVSIVAMGDVFEDKLKESREKLKNLGAAFAVTDDMCFTGFDAFQKVLQTGVDVVLLTAPPAFRPAHLRAAIDAGKHVFAEKPVAVDPKGIRSIIESAHLAKQKGLGIAAGTQRRHQRGYQEVIRRIHDGTIGDIVSAACYWIGDYDYYKAVLREKNWTDMEWQLRNWNYFTWISGDHIVEQHVHNLDVINWALQAHPIKAVGLGGRQQRTGPEFGHIYDHFSVEFEYPSGVRVQSLCRQNSDTYTRVAEHLVGARGTANPAAEILGPSAYKFEGEKNNPYEQEHADLIASIRAGNPINEGVQVAESTMAAIIGRMSCYTGQEVAWDWAMNESKLNLFPDKLEMGALPEGTVAIPGVTKLV